MFFKKKEVKEVVKKELLYKENILVGCVADTQENVIRKMGRILVDTGYVEEPYIDAMIEREKTYSTYMGSDLALPHGVEAAKKEVKASGIAIMVFPEGTVWGDDIAKVVIGIAGVGEEHLNILGVIAEKMMNEDAAKQLIEGDVETIYNMFAGK
ncbi:MAG: PTS sugar transporter subunit IIA [Eubacteriales bacterium]